MKASQAGVHLFSDQDKDKIAQCYMDNNKAGLLELSISNPKLFNHFKESLRENGFLLPFRPGL